MTKDNQRALIGVAGEPLHLAPFAFGVVQRGRNAQPGPNNVLHVYWGEARTSEPVTSLEDIVITAANSASNALLSRQHAPPNRLNTRNARPVKPNAAPPKTPNATRPAQSKTRRWLDSLRPGDRAVRLR